MQSYLQTTYVSQNIDENPRTRYFQEPIVLRGNGNIIIFGLNNHFNTEMPSKLHSRVAPEEYKATIEKVNTILKKKISVNSKLLLCGCVCFCCTFGASLCPAVVFSKQSKQQLIQLLDVENSRLYNKLGLHWSLIKYRDSNIPLTEYMLQLEFLRKFKLNVPD